MSRELLTPSELGEIVILKLTSKKQWVFELPGNEDTDFSDLENSDFHRKMIENCVESTKILPAALTT